MLLLSLAPIFGEVLSALQIAGIILALGGIAWVVMSHEEPPDTPSGHTRRGVILGVLAGLGQAVGLVLSKQGMFGDFSPFQANAIRMLAAVIFVWGWMALEGKVGATFTALRGKPHVLRLLALGALVGPLLGGFGLAACRPTCGGRRGKHPHGILQKAIYFSVDISP